MKLSKPVRENLLDLLTTKIVLLDKDKNEVSPRIPIIGGDIVFPPATHDYVVTGYRIYDEATGIATDYPIDYGIVQKADIPSIKNLRGE